MEAYFDNSATTKVLDCVKDAGVDAMCVNYGNAAAKHRKGVEAENLIREAKKAITDTLKVQEKEILFTSGGTESNNTALIDHEEMVPTWRQRDYSSVSVGTPYKWQGQVYKLWQQHDATEQPDWSPDQAVSMWDVCHTTDPVKAKPYTAPQGSRGMWQEGECCVEQEHVWRCKKDSTVYPPSQLPDSWEDLGSTEDVQEVAL